MTKYFSKEKKKVMKNLVVIAKRRGRYSPETRKPCLHAE
jgi:hypothetical protein